jgi:hypothetical protein
MAPLTRMLARLAAWIAAAAVTLTSVTAQQAEVTLENDVKATFLYNFTKYVEWPASAFSGDDDPFRVCVIGSPLFANAVDRVIAGEDVDGHRLMRVAPETVDAARSCHILFIGAGERARAERLLAGSRAAPVLTVGDAPESLSRGTTIAFVTEGNRVRFDVNAADARGRNLTVSSKLLRVARKVLEAEP